MDVYVFQAALHCDECGRDIQSGLENSVPLVKRDTSDRYPQGPYGDGGGEADCPQHCDTCRVFLENPLTSDGEEYVRTKLAMGDGNQEVLNEWRAYYNYL